MEEGSEQSCGQGQGGVVRENESKVMFMEQLDYKMEIEEPAASTKMVLLNRDQLSEEEKREAFKKKLRKYSGLVRA